MEVIVNDKGVGILSKYDVTVNKTGRAKGAMLLDTDKGFFLLKEFKGTKRHLEFEENLLNRISELGDISVDNIVRDIEGNLVNEDINGQKYLLRKWYDAKDMEAKNINHLMKAVSALGRLHSIINKITYENIYLNECFNIQESSTQLVLEFEKHNREMKRTRTFIRGKQKKNEFESMVLESFDMFYEDGIEVVEIAQKKELDKFISGNMELGRIVHGV